MNTEELEHKAFIIAHYHVHGMTDALTDAQEKKDLKEKIVALAKEYSESNKRSCKPDETLNKEAVG